MSFVAVQNGRVSYLVPVLESIGSNDRYKEWLLVARTSHETRAFPCVEIVKNRWNGSRHSKTSSMDHDEIKSRITLWLADNLGDDFLMTHKSIGWRDS